MSDDRFKDAGQFEPKKAWADIQRKDLERKLSTPRPPPLREDPSSFSSTAWKVVKYCGYGLAALIALILLLTFHNIFPKVGPAIGVAILWFVGIYVVTCIVSTSKKIDALHAELKDLRYDLNDLKNRL